MSDLGRVAVRFDADPSGLVSGAATAAAALRRLDATAATTSRTVGTIAVFQGLQVAAGVFTSIGQAAAGIGRSLRSMAEEQSRVVEGQLAMSQRVGMTFRELSGLGYAAQLANVSLDTVVASSNRLDVALSKLQAGSKQATATFGRLGLASQDFAGKSSAERFQLIAARIAALPTSMERSASAMAVFGRGGAALLPLFSQGAGYIAEMTKEAELLGLTLNNSQAQAVDDMRDAFERASLAVGGVVRQVVAVLSPAIKGVVDQFTQFIINAEGAKIGAQIGAGILDGARALADYADSFVGDVGKVWDRAEEIRGQWAETWDLAERVGGVFKMASSALNIVVGSLLHAAGELYLRAGYLIEGIKLAGKVLSGTSVATAYEEMQANLAPVEAFNKSLKAQVDSNIEAFKQGFNQTFGDTKSVEKVAGPFRTALEKGIRQAAENQRTLDIKADQGRAAKDEAAAKRMADAMADQLEARMKQVKGIDSRSQEGLDAFFRWQRGDDGNSIQRQQLQTLERIAVAVEEPDDAVAVDMGA